MEADSSGRILLVNRAAERMFGYSREELLQLRIEQLVPEEFRDRHVQHRARYMQKPVTRPMGLGLEVSARRKNGSTFPVEIGLSPNRLGKDLKIIVVVHDVSERNRMQEALRLSEEKLRRAEKLEAVARMAGGTAHEFNNLLTMLMGYSSLMLSSLESKEKLVDYIDKVNKASRRAAEVTRQLLAFSHRQVLSLEVIDLNKQLAEDCKSLQPLLGSKIKLELQLAPEALCIYADPAQIHQVLVNLARNARDAMPEGGELSIKVAPAELDEKDSGRHPGALPGKYVELTVSDTGVGMTQEIQAHVFEPFFSTKEFGKGSGMGLAVTYGIVQQSKGSISVKSTRNKGTTFSILLPRVMPGEPFATETVPVSGKAVRKGTILLVEDEPALRELAREFLGRQGYKVLDCANGEAAIEVAKKFGEGIDLVLSDLVLTGMNGREAARQIKEMRPGIKTLYVSGYAYDALAEDEVLPADEAILEKPFTFEQLAARIREVLSRPIPDAGSAN